MASTKNEIVFYDVVLLIHDENHTSFSFLFSDVQLDFISTERFKRELDAVRNHFKDRKVDIRLCQKNVILIK